MQHNHDSPLFCFKVEEHKIEALLACCINGENTFIDLVTKTNYLKMDRDGYPDNIAAYSELGLLFIAPSVC